MCGRIIFIFTSIFSILINFDGFVARKAFGPRIIGGQEASKGQFPFIVLINGVCAGSILTPDFILTAGHCTSFYDHRGKLHLMSYFHLSIGQTRISDNPNWINRGVKKVILHENYTNNGRIVLNDIALLELDNSIIFGPNIQPVQLPTEDLKDLDSQFFTAIGWGLTETGFQANHLLFVDMQGVPWEKCQADLDDLLTNKVELHEGILCAMSTVRNPLGGTCQGDSGGPLVIEDTNILVGLTSWGPSNCLQKPHPFGFTRVSFYLDWIYRQIGKI